METKARPTILVVDDDRLVRVTIVSGLREQGYTVFEAESGEEAMVLALSQPVDLALLDIRMEGLSGIELAQQLRTHTSVPVMFLTAHGDADLVNEAIEQGALGYMVKPVDLPQLLPAIATALARAGELRALRESKAHLSAELAGAREVSLATGVIMQRKGVDRTQAFELLRSHARSQRRKLREVAADLVRACEVVSLTK
jgi:AmiR/NasT family two-component response regulator